MVVLQEPNVETRIAELDGVGSGYRHYQKRITPSLDFETPANRLKWYDIGFTSMPISPELSAEARDFLLAEVRSGRFAQESEIGFVLLHDCGDVIFLIVSTWRNSNELWETVYIKQRDNGGGFEPINITGLHRPCYCVWEMGAVAHESQAWTRYLLSARDAAARETYYFDMYSGLI